MMDSNNQFVDPETAKKMKGRWAPDARILDVGCGVGHITAQIAQQVPAGYVLGADKDPVAVAQAIHYFPPLQYPNLTFRQADARELEFAEAPFDFVVSRACLHYLSHPGLAFSAIAANLKPGGSMQMWCLGMGNAAQINKTLQRLTQRPQWKSYFADFHPTWGFVTPASCDTWLQKAGMTKSKGSLVNQKVDFPTRFAFLDWFSRNWCGYLERVPAGEYTKFIREFLMAYCPSLDGPFKAHLVWLNIEATRP